MFIAPHKKSHLGLIKFVNSSPEVVDGMFLFRHPRMEGVEILVVASEGSGWEHVSVSLKKGKVQLKRCPTWSEMCWVKDQFWGEEDRVVQYHPPKSEYVNCHPFVLHLWRQIGVEIPSPPAIMVGPKQ